MINREDRALNGLWSIKQRGRHKVLIFW